MIRFKYITLEGFGSVGSKLTYVLDNPGINIIQADNGTGKTTIFSGLCWVLYGKTLKPKSQVQTWPDNRPSDFSGTRGIVKLVNHGHTYIIKRYEKYKIGNKAESKLVLIQDGKERLDLRGKADIKLEIEKVIGLSFELFKNSVIFGQKMKRIIEEDGPTKKRVFDEAFDMGYLQIAKDNAELRKRDLQVQINSLNSDISNKALIKRQLLSQLSDIKNTIENFEVDKAARIKSERKGLNVFKSKLAELESTPKMYNEPELNRLRVIEKEFDAKDNEIFKLEFMIENMRGDLGNLKSEIDKLKSDFTNPPMRCPTCGKLQDAKAKPKKEVLTSKISLLKKEINKVNQSIEVEEDKLKALRDYKSKNHKIKFDIQNQLSYKTLDGINSNNIANLVANIADCRGRIKKIKKEKLKVSTKDIKLKLDKATKELLELTETHDNLADELELTNWLIKDPLSNSGIKAFVFNQMLGLVNDRLRIYSNQLGFTIRMGIDLESANKDFYISLESGNSIRLYDDLSGGESQVVNICIAFAIHDVICDSGKDVNILVLDEVFESLDSSNIEMVANLITQKSKNKSCHIITHHREFNPINAKIISLSKEGGITKIIT
jgi:DNA repair exonuclease SbcCD ATPase subunit